MGRISSDFKRTLCGGLFLAALSPMAASAAEQVGVLECHLSGNGITVLIENQALDCAYEDEMAGGKPQHYLGKLTKVGANIGVNGPGDLVWGVVAETNALAPGALTGDYVGPEASLRVGVGGGGAILVGGSNNTISLQPFNVEGGEGLGLSAGAENVSLTYVPDLPPPPIKHKVQAVYWGHLHAAIHHAKEAVEAGRAGQAEAVAHHAEAALHHAEAAERARANPHLKEAFGHLHAAIKQGKEGHAEAATKHAGEALEHLEAARK
jgi:hypothetical protein